MTLVSEINSRLRVLQKNYEKVLKQNEDKINANVGEIDILGQDIDQIFAEIKHCDVEVEKVKTDFDAIKANLDATRPDTTEYDLVDQNLVDKMLEAADQRKDQYLGEITQTVEMLNDNLDQVRTRINELGTENDALLEASELLEGSYETMISEFNDMLGVFSKEITKLEDAVEKDLSVKTPLTREARNSNKEKTKKSKKEDIPTVNETIFDLSKVLTEKEKKPKEDYSRLEELGYSKEEINELKLAIPYDQYIEIISYADEFNVSLASMKPYFNDILGVKDVTKESEPIVDNATEIIDLTQHFEATPVIAEAPVIEETEPTFIQSADIIDFDKPFGSDEQVLEPEIEKEVVKERVEASEVVTIVKEDTIDEPILEPVIETTEQPASEEIAVVKPSDEYRDIERIGLNLQQQQELKSKMSKDTYIQLTNIIQNHGVALEDIVPYFEEFKNLKEPQKLDEVFSLLRGADKNNDNFDFSAMLGEILNADPAIVQDNLLQAYADGIDPKGLGIQVITSKYYDNIKQLNEEGFNTELLLQQFPMRIVSMPAERFIQELKGLSSNEEQTLSEELDKGRGLAA